LENLLRNEDGRTVTKADIEAVAAWTNDKGKSSHEIAYRPARVLMQDFTGVPAVVDLAAMRDATSLWAAIRKRSTRWCRSIWSSTTR
jgi:aconitate hydratase